jgi:hypothetical protein
MKSGFIQIERLNPNLQRKSKVSNGFEYKKELMLKKASLQKKQQ